jgi:hypothetical protein
VHNQNLRHGFAPVIWSAFGRIPKLRRDVEAREVTVLTGIRAGGEQRMEWAGWENGCWETFVGLNNRVRQGAALVDSAGGEAVTLVEDGGSDRVGVSVGGAVGGMATEKFLVLA